MTLLVVAMAGSVQTLAISLQGKMQGNDSDFPDSDSVLFRSVFSFFHTAFEHLTGFP